MTADRQNELAVLHIHKKIRIDIDGVRLLVLDWSTQPFDGLDNFINNFL